MLSSSKKSGSSPSKQKLALCLVCGSNFTKASLPSHQKNCVRKRVGKPAKLQSNSVPRLTKPSSPLACKKCNKVISVDIIHKCPSSFSITNPPLPNSTAVKREFLKMKPHLVEGEYEEPIKQPYQKEQYEEEDEEPFKVHHEIHNNKSPSPDPYPQQHQGEEELQEYPTSQQATHPCKICNRTFADTARLEKHTLACQKMNKPRKTFDATRARVKGTELEKYVLKKTAASTTTVPPKEELPIKPKKNWRVKNNAFKPERVERPNPQDYYTQCPHCLRKFNELAAERHVPICMENKKRAEYRGKPDEDVNRQKRFNYRPNKN